jgi:S1-C subfamily serine protease
MAIVKPFAAKSKNLGFSQRLMGLIFFAILGLVFFSSHLTAADSDDTTPSTAGNPSGSASAPSDAAENSVVKVFSTVRYPDYYRPWTKEAPTEVSGSGVVIKGKRILTNAHVVLYASQIQVQANGSGNLVSATVESISPGMDLAVLKVDDDSFFDSHPPLEWASGPPGIQDPVAVYGYPVGGDNLSITKGIVSRVEFAAYNFPNDGLRAQIDAAINPGNSGGPVVVNGKMIGIAFSKLSSEETEGIGYIIPCEEINLFLQSLSGGHYHEKPRMEDECQPLLNPALRSFLGLDNTVQGVVVSGPAETNDDYPLKKWDVITQIGDASLDNEGAVSLNGDLHVYFKYLVQKDATNGLVPLTVIRDGKKIQVQLPVAGHARLVPFIRGGYPSYFVYGPVVFSVATAEFIGGYMHGSQGATRMAIFGFSQSPLVTRMGDKPAFNGEELVVVSSPLFPDRLSRGYTNPIGQVVKSINDIPVKNLKDLVQIIRDAKTKYIRIGFDGLDAPTLVFPRAEMTEETDSILTDNDIRSQGSPDVMAVWNAGSSQ